MTPCSSGEEMTQILSCSSFLLAGYYPFFFIKSMPLKAKIHDIESMFKYLQQEKWTL